LRGKSPLGATLERKVTTYVKAATAAGIGLAIAPQVSEARIIYTPVDIKLYPNQHYSLDLNHDGITDFVIFDSRHINFACSQSRSHVENYVVVPLNQSHGARGSSELVSALYRGDPIGPGSRFFATGRGWLASRTYGWEHYILNICKFASNYRGRFYNVKNRYLGLKFIINNQTHFGWTRLSIHFVRGLGLKIRLTGYAFQTKPDKLIVAGDEGTGAKSLGHLALGAAGKK
jgi:hypothetical protein